MEKQVEHTPDREKDVQKVCEAVLEMSPNCWDNPNGAYESTCPFCYETEYRGGSSYPWASMDELDHKSDCVYLVAKDLAAKGH